ncbi:MAG: serine/threonine-protein kinase [Kofleriaceae bacterium]
MDLPGKIGRYQILGLVARGGMAEILRAKSIGLAGFEKLVAVKRIAPAQAREPRFVRSFIDEARIAAQLSHRHIVPVFDFGAEGDELYLVMELVDGHDLRAIIDRARAAGTVMPPPLVCHVVAAVAAGLAHAHQQADGHGRPLRIVHCDVSPANVMVSAEGEVKILDFGVARASFGHAVERRRLRGKPRYMAPEQTRGETPTAATDVFALATVAWELATGRPLFDCPDIPTTLAAVRTQPVPAFAEAGVPAPLAATLDEALARAPADRPSAQAIALAAATAAAGAGARALAAWLDELVRPDAAAAAAAPTSAGTLDTVDQPIPRPTSLVTTTRQRAHRGFPVLAEATDVTTAPVAGGDFDDDATRAEAVDVAWLDDDPEVQAAAARLLAPGVERRDRQAGDDTQPPPTTRSPS